MESQNPLIKQRIKNGSIPTYQDQCLTLSNKIDASSLPLYNKIDTSIQQKKKKPVKKTPKNKPINKNSPPQPNGNPHNPPTHTHNHWNHRHTPIITITVASSSTKKPKKKKATLPIPTSPQAITQKQTQQPQINHNRSAMGHGLVAWVSEKVDLMKWESWYN